LLVVAAIGCGGGGGTPTPGSGGQIGSGGNPGSGGGSTGSGGVSGSGGQAPVDAGSGGQGGAVVDAAADVVTETGGDAATDGAIPAGNFSFFVTSLVGMRRVSKSADGFGGDLRYGQPDGLSGADKICTEIADFVSPGVGAKGWRAFLSVSSTAVGGAVNAIDRVGAGPWYDRQGRLVAMTKADLAQTRPRGAATAILNDLPNEYGIPNRRPDPSMPEVDNHHVLTGSDTVGRLYVGQLDPTCKNWTTADRASGSRPRIGFSWIAGGRTHWISGQDEGGCGAGVKIDEGGGSDPSNPIVGSGGGYGAIYCFALKP
jgi:hypothetical protein